jgi:hypothetical protein
MLLSFDADGVFAAARDFVLFGVERVMVLPPSPDSELVRGTAGFGRVHVSLHTISLPEVIASFKADDIADEVRVPALIVEGGFQARLALDLARLKLFRSIVRKIADRI